MNPGRVAELNKLDCVWPSFAGTNPNAIIHRQHEHLTVTDLPFGTRLGRTNYSGYRWFDELVIDRDLQLNFA